MVGQSAAFSKALTQRCREFARAACGPWTLVLALCLPCASTQAQSLLPAGNGLPPASAAAAQSAGTRSGMERQEIRAQLMPRRYTTIAAEIGAKINSIPSAEGDVFKAGQLLVRFDCSLQEAQLQKAQAELDAAEQTYKSNQRMAELNSIGQLELDLSRSALGKARAERGANDAVLAKCQVLAPFGGRIAEQKAREQQYVQPGQPLLDIIDDSVLELEFLVPSNWLTWLRVGGGFKVTIDETRKTYPAKFVRIGARVDAVSQSIKVAATIDGRFSELIAGMSGRVQVSPSAPKN